MCHAAPAPATYVTLASSFLPRSILWTMKNSAVLSVLRFSSVTLNTGHAKKRTPLTIVQH